jgi:hypothetical protein
MRRESISGREKEERKHCSKLGHDSQGERGHESQGERTTINAQVNHMCEKSWHIDFEAIVHINRGRPYNIYCWYSAQILRQSYNIYCRTVVQHLLQYIDF